MHGFNVSGLCCCKITAAVYWQELFKVDSGPDFVPLNEMSPIKLRSAHQHLVLRAGDQGIGYYMVHLLLPWLDSYSVCMCGCIQCVMATVR